MIQKKSQTWGFDLIIASVIFVFAILVFYFYVLNYSSNEEQSYNSLHYEARLIGDSLLGEGSPPNWNASNVERIGLTSQEKINKTKVLLFYEMTLTDYNKVRKLFRINNHFFINLSKPILSNNTQIKEIGIQPSSPNNVYKLTRIAPSDDKIIVIEIISWN